MINIVSSMSADVHQLPWCLSWWLPKVSVFAMTQHNPSLCVSGLLLIRTLALWHDNRKIKRILLVIYFVSVLVDLSSDA